MTENEIRELVKNLRNRVETFVNSGCAIDGLINDYTKSADTIEKLFEEIQKYRAIGTVEEVQKAKMQYDDIHSVAEKTALIGLSDYGTAKEALITEMKRSIDCSLKEYQSIGTIAEFKALKEKNEPKKAMHNGANWYRCPNGCEVHKKAFEKDWYCPKCGVKLDWSE